MNFTVLNSSCSVQEKHDALQTLGPKLIEEAQLALNCPERNAFFWRRHAILGGVTRWDTNKCDSIKYVIRKLPTLTRLVEHHCTKEKTPCKSIQDIKNGDALSKLQQEKKEQGSRKLLNLK